MKEGTLYDVKDQAGSYNLDIEIGDEEYSKVDNDISNGNDTISIKVKVVKGHTGNEPLVFIKFNYKELIVDSGLILSNIQVKSIQKEDLYPENTCIEIEGYIK